MKLIHLGDLHIGKRVNEFSMIEDQKHVLKQIVAMVDNEQADAILIAGDVYDKSQPTVEAVELFDSFLTDLSQTGRPVLLISGNHDSPERLNFGKRIMEKNQIHICGVFRGSLERVTLNDENGPCNIYLLPFIKPAMVRPFFEEEIESYEDAVRLVIDKTKINNNERNILVAHQFVTGSMGGPEQSDSETIVVGGVDQISYEVFDSFDYVALGHLHAPQQIGREEIRYAGSPLKYSFSEVRHKKGVTLVSLKEKGKLEIKKLPLAPLHEMREIRGPIAELIRAQELDEEGRYDYIHATITDEEEIYDAVGQLRQVCPNLMTLDFENRRTRESQDSELSLTGNVAEKNPLELFQEFYHLQNNEELSPEQEQLMRAVLEEAGGRVG